MRYEAWRDVNGLEWTYTPEENVRTLRDAGALSSNALKVFTVEAADHKSAQAVWVAAEPFLKKLAEMRQSGVVLDVNDADGVYTIVCYWHGWSWQRSNTAFSGAFFAVYAEYDVLSRNK